MLTPLFVREDDGRLCYVLTTNFTNHTNLFLRSFASSVVYLLTSDYTDFTDSLSPTSISAAHSLRYKTVFHPSLLYI